MLTTAQIKSQAYELAKLGDIKLSPVIRLLFDLADQLDFYQERDTISDSRIALLRNMDDNCKEEVRLLQQKLLVEHETNIELRKQVSMLKNALIDGKILTCSSQSNDV